MDVNMADANLTASKSLGLFEDVSYTVISPPQLPGEDPGFTELLDELNQNGATFVPLNDETNRVRDFRKLTHIISTTSDFEDYEIALDNYIAVVKPAWIRMSLTKKKQPNPRQFSPDPALILNDVVVCCGDIPEGDKEAIMGGVLAMGGLNSEIATKMVTHIVALHCDDKTVQKAVERKLKCKIVLPHWFDDCLRLGRKISEVPYTLPDAEVFALDHDGPPIQRNNSDIRSAITPTPQNMPSSASKNPRLATVFKGRNVMLSSDLGVGRHTRGTIEAIVRDGGGQTVSEISEADIYVCQYREGEDYIEATQVGKDVGNLSWLYHLITHNKWTQPMRRLLHYPVPRNGVPGFEGLAISITNYSGDARVYVESLVKACGADFSKTLKQENTHLIAAHTTGEKCEAAAEWNINVVNHLWLEESYAQHKLQVLTVKRYTHFPPRTNLGEVVGQTQIDRAAVEKNFLPGRAKTKQHTRQLSDGKAIPQSAMKLQAKQPVEPGSVLKVVRNIDDDLPTTDRKGKRSFSDTFATPAAQRTAEGKENETPHTTGSRGAKSRALSKLHDAAKDIALYDKERKRVGGVIHGKRRRGSGAAETVDDSRLTPESESETANEEEDVEISARPEKKAKTGKRVPIQHRVLLTMYDRWTTNPSAQTTDKNKLRNLGIHIVDDPSATNSITILCAPRLARTRKFVCGLAYAPEVVSTSFLDHCLTKKEIPPFEKYRLVDEEGEEKMGFKLMDSMKRAKENNRKLLKGWQIFCTEKIPAGFQTFKDIIEANGGRCYMFRAKMNMTVSKRAINDEIPDASQADDTLNTLYLISGSSSGESELWSKFQGMARKADMVPVIAMPDWLLTIAMSQRIHWKDEWALLK